MKEKLIAFFESHPDTDIVFEALGVLWLSLDDATQYCAGTNQKPTTYTRVQVMLDETPEAPVVKTQEAPVEEESPITEEAKEVLNLPPVGDDVTKTKANAKASRKQK